MSIPANTKIQNKGDASLAGEDNRSEYRGILLAIGLAMIPFISGKILEFRSDGPFDGARVVYDAQMILHGGKFPQDYVPTARPAMLLVNVIGVGIFGYSELGPELLQLLFQTAALGLMFFTLRKVYGLLPAAAALFL